MEYVSCNIKKLHSKKGMAIPMPRWKETILVTIEMLHHCIIIASYVGPYEIRV